MSETFNKAVEYAKKTMVKDGRIEPVLMAYNADSVFVVPMAKLFGPERDTTLMDMLTIYFLAHGVTSYVLMHEAPMRFEPAEGKPRRVEAVMVVEVTRETQSVSVHEIQRTPELGATLLPFPLKPGVLSGRLMSLLPSDDFTVEDIMIEIADSIVNSMGSRMLPRKLA